MEPKALAIIAMGVLLSWVGWRHWVHRDDDESVSLIEAAILQGEEPMPRSGVDRFLSRLQALAGMTIGPLLVLGGLAALFA